MEQKTDWVFSVGDLIGKYRVIEPIGAGAFGQVYKVEWDTENITRTAALKILIEISKRI